MLGVTIAIGNSYKRMGARATASFAKNAGLETRIVTPEWTRGDARISKLDLFDLVSEDRFMFFDADMLMIRQDDLSFGFVDGWGGVGESDNWLIDFDCQAQGLDRAKYFNSGIMWLDRSQHEEIFLRAKEMHVSGLADQTPLNVAVQRAEMPVTMFDERYNRIITGEDDIPDDTVIAHAVACRDPMAGRQWVMDLEF